MAAKPSVAIIGATGKTGKWALRGALQREYQVKALVRSPDKLEGVLKSIFPDTDVKPYLERITVVKGNATDKDALVELCKDTQVVMSFLGMVKKGEWIVKPGVEAVVQALKSTESPPKFLTMSSIGLSDSRAQANKAWCYCVVKLTIDMMLKECFADMQAAEDFVVANRQGLNITVVRASILKDKKDYFKDYTSSSKNHKLQGADDMAKMSFQIDRQHVAEAFLDLVDSAAWDNKEVSVFAAGPIDRRELAWADR